MKLVVLSAVLALGGCNLYLGDSGNGGGDDVYYGPPPSGWPGNPGLPTDPQKPPVDGGGCDGGGSGSDGGQAPPACAHQIDVIGIYQTLQASSGSSDAAVQLDVPGVHTLVVSAYEPTTWHIYPGPGVTIDKIYLTGHGKQTTDVTWLPVVVEDYADGGPSLCGYSYPYNGQGCDTDALFAHVAQEVGPVTTFHGCYQATKWWQHADGSVTSDCDTASGYHQDEYLGTCGSDDSAWQPSNFTTLAAPLCDGPRYVKFDAAYQLWVGAIQCGAPQRYKLYLSDAADQPFLQVADYAGHGQDHCELVNPAFTIPDEDDITSGGCTQCSIGNLVDVQDEPVYVRAVFGEPFKRVTSVAWADLTTTFYACGVSIP